MGKSASFRIKATLCLYILHYTVSFAFYLILCPACHCCPLRGFYHFWSIRGLPSSTSCIILNTLEVTFKPRIVCPFPITCSQPLWSDSLPFGLSVSDYFRLSRFTTLTVVQLSFSSWYSYPNSLFRLVF